MTCKKCGYKDLKEVEIYGSLLCRVCATFAPENLRDFQNYIIEKIDWKKIDTFRNHGQFFGRKQKEGMAKKAKTGSVVSRPPYGYTVEEGKLKLNEDSSKVFSLFNTFLNRDYSLNSLAKNYGLSVNGIKKILTNRSYLGEIKFDGKTHKGNHEPLVPADLFFSVQKKLCESVLRKKMII